MGRYYSGDIEGKFWFGVQDSQDGEFFGAEAEEARSIDYVVSDLNKVKEGISTCLDKLGDNLAKLDKFFNENNGYNDQMLLDAGFKEDELHTIMVWYARLALGKKIRDYMEENNEEECHFEAEM